MWLLDQWAERHILDVRAKDEFGNLSGSGESLTLDDDSRVPAELRAGYRLLKNARYLPPELEQRREAVVLADLLRGARQDDPRHVELNERLALPELKPYQAGLGTDFLRGERAEALLQKMNQE